MDERAVVDRFEDGDFAVLLVGEDEIEVIVPRGEIPDGTVEGSVLRVTIEDGRLTSASLDSADTAETRWRVADKMRRLRQRGRRL